MRETAEHKRELPKHEREGQARKRGLACEGGLDVRQRAKRERGLSVRRTAKRERDS